MMQDFVPRKDGAEQKPRRSRDDPLASHSRRNARAPEAHVVTYIPSLHGSMIHALSLLGATDIEMAEALSVPLTTLQRWKEHRYSFGVAYRAGGINADAQMAASLYMRGVGYSHPAEKIFLTKDGEIVRAEYTEHYPPDVKAQEIWLKMRRPRDWRAPTESAVPLPPGPSTVNNTLNVTVSADEAMRVYQRLVDGS